MGARPPWHQRMTLVSTIIVIVIFATIMWAYSRTQEPKTYLQEQCDLLTYKADNAPTNAQASMYMDDMRNLGC